MRYFKPMALSLRCYKAQVGFATPLHTHHRYFYDQIKKEQEGSSTDGPDNLFSEFPKSPDAQRIPEEFRNLSPVAVDAAARIHTGFLVFLVVALPFLFLFIDPYNSDQYYRPHLEGHVSTSALRRQNTT